MLIGTMQTDHANEAYNLFLEIFLQHYETAFPKVTKTIKLKSLWITKGLIKSSKRKQRLYEKFLKHRSYQNEIAYKTYKNLFESIKNKSKKSYYSEQINKYKNDSRKTWNVIKEVIGKTKIKKNIIPLKLVENNIEIKDEHLIADTFNKCFVNIGPNLALNIDDSDISFKSYLEVNSSKMETPDLTSNFTI